MIEFMLKKLTFFPLQFICIVYVIQWRSSVQSEWRINEPNKRKKNDNIQHEKCESVEWCRYYFFFTIFFFHMENVH